MIELKDKLFKVPKWIHSPNKVIMPGIYLVVEVGSDYYKAKNQKTDCCNSPIVISFAEMNDYIATEKVIFY